MIPILALALLALAGACVCACRTHARMHVRACLSPPSATAVYTACMHGHAMDWGKRGTLGWGGLTADRFRLAGDAVDVHIT